MSTRRYTTPVFILTFFLPIYLSGSTLLSCIIMNNTLVYLGIVIGSSKGMAISFQKPLENPSVFKGIASSAINLLAMTYGHSYEYGKIQY
jgi:hypothetical protein